MLSFVKEGKKVLEINDNGDMKILSDEIKETFDKSKRIKPDKEEDRYE